MMGQIHEMEENIRRAKKGDFRVSIIKMEVSVGGSWIRSIQPQLLELTFLPKSQSPLINFVQS